MLINDGEARQFLARVMPWPDEGIVDGYCNVHWTSPGREDPKRNFWSGRGCRTPDELVRQFEWIATKFTDAQNFYVCMSRQRNATEKTSKSGKAYLSAERSSAAAIELKSLFLDIDFKQYADAQEAYAALKAFLLASALPKPSVLVLTGGGLHVYWTFEHNLTPAEWAPLAHALVAAARKHGLKFDSACTIDAARILRIPGTQNFKYDPPRDTRLLHCSPFDYVLDAVALPLQPFIGMVPQSSVPVAFPLPAKPPLLESSDMAAGIETMPPLPVREIFRKCGVYQHALLTGGADYANPLWHLLVLGSTWMEKGREIAHCISKGHASYTPEETDKLFDRKLKDRKERGIGWPSCAAVNGVGGPACATCPHFAAGKSPLNLALLTKTNGAAPLLVAATAPPVQPLPAGYSHNTAGLVCRETLDTDGSTLVVAICGVPITDAHLSKTPTGWVFYFTAQLDCLTEIELPCEQTGSPDMRRTLQKQGFMVQADELKELGRFLVSWIKELEQRKEAVTSASPFGWTYVNGRRDGFVYDSRIWTANGTKPAPPADPVLARHYAPSGEIAPWVAAANMITDQHRPGLEAVLASSFAAPLVAFADQSGLMLSLYSPESGIGKTTAVRVAQAVWGDPIQAVQSLSDTTNSVMNKLGETRSLPLYWDEMKTPDEIAKLVFQLTQGKEKSRMTQAVRQRESGEWQTLMVVSSNESVLNAAMQHSKTSSAGLLRMFEYQLPPPNGHGQLSTSEASRIVGRLNQNHGQVGLQYAQWLGAHHQQVDQDMAAALKRIEVEIGAVPDERFWTATVAVIELAARYANTLGFTHLDEPALNTFMREQFYTLRQEHSRQPNLVRQAVHAESVFASFLQAQHRQTQRTNIIWDGPGRPTAGQVTPFPPLATDGVHVQIGMTNKIIRFSKDAFDEWLNKNGHNGKMIVDAMRENFKLEEHYSRLCSGLPGSAYPQQLLYELNAKHPQAAKLLSYLQL